MFTKKKKFHKESLKKMDTVVTGFILGWVVASIYGITRKKKAIEVEKTTGLKRKMVWKILKMLILGYEEPKTEKPGFWKRLFTKK